MFSLEVVSLLGMQLGRFRQFPHWCLLSAGKELRNPGAFELGPGGRSTLRAPWWEVLVGPWQRGWRDVFELRTAVSCGKSRASLEADVAPGLMSGHKHASWFQPR